MSSLLITGATGFVGAALLSHLDRDGIPAARLLRRAARAARAGDLVAGDDFRDIASVWPTTLRPDVVVHLAARVHVMQETVANPLEAFRETNVRATLRLAEAAHRSGATRFVYVSSIKAIAERDAGRPLREDDPAHPSDPYGVSKREAETALFDFGRQHGMEIVVLRPPLVYGPGVGANFMRLLRAVERGTPLPLGLARAPRSLVAVDNLASALVVCACHPEAAGEIFHVADDEAPGVAALIRRIGVALGRPARLVPVPVMALRAAAALVGKAGTVRRLVDPLRVDNGRLAARLGWRPPLTLDQALRATADWYWTAAGVRPELERAP